MSSDTDVPIFKRQQNSTEILRSQHELHKRLYLETETQNEILRDPMSGLDNCIVNHQVRVKIEDVDMPFWAIVGLMVKVAIASIPALIILMIIFGMFLAALLGFFAGIS